MHILRSRSTRLILVCIISIIALSTSHAGVVISRSVIGSAATQGAAGGFRLWGTLGQTVVGPDVAAGMPRGGFWYLAAPDTTVIAVEPPTHLSTPVVSYFLAQNAPNPFSEDTRIRFGVPVKTHVSVRLYDIRGRQVAELINTELAPGEYATTLSLGSLPNGLYFYELRTREFCQHKKLMKIR